CKNCPPPRIRNATDPRVARDQKRQQTQLPQTDRRCGEKESRRIRAVRRQRCRSRPRRAPESPRSASKKPPQSTTGNSQENQTGSAHPRNKTSITDNTSVPNTAENK